MAKGDDKNNHLIHRDHGVKALMAAVEVHDERMTGGFLEILNMLIDIGFEGKRDHDGGRGIRIKDLAYNRSINRHVRNVNDVPYFDVVLYNEDFMDWILDLEDYFSYAKILEDFKVLFVSRDL